MATPEPKMITDYAWQVRNLVYETLATEGRAPSIAELARRADSTTSEIADALADLADAHALVLTPDGDAIRMAHPFSAAPMAFVVTPLDGFDDRRWWGGCAWDSFGISAAVGLDVRIDTVCPHCGATLSYEAGPELAPPPELAIWLPRPADEWWNDVVATCTSIRAFCNADHAESWAAERPGGQVVDATNMWKLAQPWYGDRIAPDFAPHTRDHNQHLLETCDLTGEFWQLP